MFEAVRLGYSCGVQLKSPAALPTFPHDASLRADAEAFSAALAELARIYQLQDPRQTCAYGLTMTECYALEAVVERGPLTVNEVARFLALDKSTASRAVAGLVKKGYAARETHPADGRALQVRATRPGERLLERIHAAARRTYEEILRDFPPKVRRHATALLRRLAAAERSCASERCAPCP